MEAVTYDVKSLLFGLCWPSKAGFVFYCVAHNAKASGKHKVYVGKTVYHRTAQVGKDLRSSGSYFGGKESLGEIT